MAFRLKDETAASALDYLNTRESRLGGYMTHTTMFYPKSDSIQPFPAVLFTATSENELWLGDAPLEEIAEQARSMPKDTFIHSTYRVVCLLFTLLWLFHCLPNSAWAAENLAIMVRRGETKAKLAWPNAPPPCTEVFQTVFFTGIKTIKQ